MSEQFHVPPEQKHLDAAPKFQNRAGRYVGQAVARKEDARLLTGHGTYVDDVNLPGELHAHFLRSYLASAEIKSIDASAALEMPGVVAVLTYDDLKVPEMSMSASLFKMFAAQMPDRPRVPDLPLAHERVRYVGDPVVMVIATSRYVAEDAAELIDVEYEPLTPVVDYETAHERTDNIVNPSLGTNVSGEMALPLDDDYNALVDRAAHSITATFRQHRQTNVPMETRGLIASWDPYSGEMTAHVASQNPHEWRRRCADLLEIGEDRIRVIQKDVGGGFGQKNFMLREEAAVIKASHVLGKPIKWIEDRRENLMAANIARIEKGTMSFHLDEEGHLLAIHTEHIEDAGADGTAGGMAGSMLPGPYKVQRNAFAGRGVYTNTVGRAAYRGPWMYETVGREEMIEHVARKIGMDPVEIRRRNVVRWEDLPYTNASGQLIEMITPAECLDQAVEMIGYEEFRAMQKEAFESEGRLLGIGFGLYIEPSAQNVGPLAVEGATVRLAPSGKVDVYLGTGNHGQSIETTMAQIVADELGVSYDDVTIHQGDTSSTPFGGGTGGSRTANIVSGASAKASRQLRERVLAIAAHMLEANPDDLEVEMGNISVKGTPSKSVTMGGVAQMATDMAAALPPELDSSMIANAQYTHPAPTWSNACHACTVEVNPHTGGVKILRYIVSEDCGKIINPHVVEGQVAGGVVQGIGGVLYEHLQYDEDGTPLSTTFMDYLLPTATEVPDLEYGHIETPSNTEGGFKGMGEGGAIGSPPTVFNAVADALALVGAEVFDQPLDPRRVLDALMAAGR